MIDVHVHILPEIDDGSQSMEESIEMAELAVESGVEVIVATPHSNHKGWFENYLSQEFKDRYRELSQMLAKKKIPIKLAIGMEIYATEDVTQKIRNKQVIGLNDSDTYLIEFPFDADEEWIWERLEEVLDMGKRPLIAHPERYVCVQRMPAIVYDWIQMGCLTQINRGSVFGKFGAHAKRAAQILLENDLVTCIASDAHGSEQRTTYMEDIKAYIEENFGVETAKLLLRRNPYRILMGKDIEPHGRYPRKSKIFW